MKLGVRVLNSNSTLNNLMHLNQIEVSPGETATVIMQLVDLTTVSESNRIGNRYMPATGATLSVTIQSNNSANVLTKVASQPFAQDASVWQITLNATETAQIGAMDLLVTLTEGASIKKANGKQTLIADSSSPYQC